MFKLLKNDEAVSPIVATLVLIVVAIIGAAAVGMLMGTFSSNVADETSIGDTASATSAELLTAGSTSVQPLSEILAEAYMKNHQGVKVTVSGGGSDVGIMSAGMDTVDLGASSKAISTDYQAKYPNLEQHEIGGSAIVVITNNAAVHSISKDALYEIYDQADSDGKVTIDIADGAIVATDVGATGGVEFIVYQRADGSGTEEEFSKFIADESKTFIEDSNAIGKEGNQGILNAVNGYSGNAISFVDYGFAGDDGLSIDDGTEDGVYVAATKSNIVKSLKGETGGYPYYKHLYYITNGQPSALEQSFIDFATSPSSTQYFTEAGVISLYDVNKV